MRNLFLILAFVIFSGPAFADASHEDVVINVNGMVCDFCAQSVFKVFEDYESVGRVDVDLDSGSVTVHLKPGQSLSDEDLNKAIIYAGYDLVSIERIQGVQEDHSS